MATTTSPRPANPRQDTEDDVTFLAIMIACALLILGCIVLFSYLIKKDNRKSRSYLRRKNAEPNEYVTAAELWTGRPSLRGRITLPPQGGGRDELSESPIPEVFSVFSESGDLSTTASDWSNYVQSDRLSGYDGTSRYIPSPNSSDLYTRVNNSRRHRSMMTSYNASQSYQRNHKFSCDSIQTLSIDTSQCKRISKSPSVSVTSESCLNELPGKVTRDRRLPEELGDSQESIYCSIEGFYDSSV